MCTKRLRLSPLNGTSEQRGSETSGSAPEAHTPHMKRYDDLVYFTLELLFLYTL